MGKLGRSKHTHRSCDLPMTKNTKQILADQDPLFLSPSWISKYVVLSIKLYSDISRAFDILEQDKKKVKT